MSLPLSRVVPDAEAGGGIINSLNAINNFANNASLRKSNQAKAEYARDLALAEINSKNAYSQLIGLQPMSKVLSSMPAFASLNENQKNHLIQTLAHTNSNSLNRMPNNYEPSESNTLLGNLISKAKNVFNHENFANPVQANNSQTTPSQLLAQNEPETLNEYNDSNQNKPENKPENENENEDALLVKWMQSPKGKMKIKDNEYKYPSIEEMKNDLGIKTNNESKTVAQKQADYEGTVAQGKESGNNRATALKENGKSQLALSNSGAVIDRLAGIITNPVYLNMRNKIRGFQNKQLDYLKVMGNPKEQELIGDLTGTGEAFITSTIQGFAGQPLVREFDLAQRQKITGHDTPESAAGKWKSASALHNIAEKKLQIISKLLQKGHNESDAVETANKMVDVSAIEKETNARLQRKIPITNDKTGETKEVTIEEARKLGVPNV